MVANKLCALLFSDNNGSASPEYSVIEKKSHNQTETSILYCAVFDFFALSSESDRNTLLNTDKGKMRKPSCKDRIMGLVVKNRQIIS
jgi:hypothetical protein